jgi:hypothetical protein
VAHTTVCVARPGRVAPPLIISPRVILEPLFKCGKRRLACELLLGRLGR